MRYQVTHSQVVSTYTIQRVVTKQINAVKPANSWDEHLENRYLYIMYIHYCMCCLIRLGTHGCS